MFKTSAPPTNLQELTASIQQAVRVSGGYKKFQRMYANDRVAFAYDCFGKIGKQLTFYQEEILSYFDEGFTRVSVRGPHGLGKTYIAALLVHHGVLTAEDDAKIITTASAWRQVEKYLWPEIKKLSKFIAWDVIGREPYDPNHEILQMSIRLNQGTVEAFAVVSDDYQTIEGAHAKNLVYIFDEAKSIPRNTWNAAEGAFANASIKKAVLDVPIQREETGLISENTPVLQTEIMPIANAWDLIMAGIDPDVGTDIGYEQGIAYDDVVDKKDNKVSNKFAVYQPGDRDKHNDLQEGIVEHSGEKEAMHKHDNYDDSIVEHSDRRQSSSGEEYYNPEGETIQARHARAPLSLAPRAHSTNDNGDDGDVVARADHNEARSIRQVVDSDYRPEFSTNAINDHNEARSARGHDALMGDRAPIADHDALMGDRATVRKHDTIVPPVLTDNAYAFAISTPGNPDGQFYDIQTHAPGYEDWKVRHVTLDDAIMAGRITREWADQRARQWGIDSAIFKNRVLGEFADNSEEGMIPLSWVRASNELWKAWRDRGYRSEEGYRSIGVDVARSGDDKTVFAERQRFAIRQIYVYSKLSTTTVASKLIAQHDGRYLHIEMDGGLGAAVYDILKQKGIPTRLLKPITVSAPTPWRDRSKTMHFFNVRAAMWWNLREMLDPVYGMGIMLPPIEELTKDLTTPQYEPRGDNVIVLESKDSIRTRLGRSTDYADAVCLAFWNMSSGGGIVI